LGFVRCLSLKDMARAAIGAGDALPVEPTWGVGREFQEMKSVVAGMPCAIASDASGDARFSLLQSLNDQLVAADALHLDLVAIRISEAIDQLVDDLGIGVCGSSLTH